MKNKASGLPAFCTVMQCVAADHTDSSANAMSQVDLTSLDQQQNRAAHPQHALISMTYPAGRRNCL